MFERGGRSLTGEKRRGSKKGKKEENKKDENFVLYSGSFKYKSPIRRNWVKGIFFWRLTRGKPSLEQKVSTGEDALTSKLVSLGEGIVAKERRKKD